MISTVKVKIIRHVNCWTEIYVDNKRCGQLEDPEGEVTNTIKNLINYLDINNTEVIEEIK